GSPARALTRRIPCQRQRLPAAKARNARRIAPAENQFYRGRNPSAAPFVNDALTKCAVLLRWSKLWFAGTGATDAPECADPCPSTTAVPAPPTLLMDRPRPIPSRRKAADQSRTRGRVQRRVGRGAGLHAVRASGKNFASLAVDVSGARAAALASRATVHLTAKVDAAWVPRSAG